MNWLVFTLGVFVVCYFGFFIIKNRKQRSFHKDNMNNGVFSIYYSTIFRSIGILIVVLGHMGNQFGIRYLTPLGGIGVTIFLIFSGFGLNESLRINGLKYFWEKRLITSYLPYLIIEIVGILFVYEDVTIVKIIKDILLIDSLHPFGWYMSYLFLWYIIFYSVVKFVKDEKKITYCFIVIGILLFFALGKLPAQQSFSFLAGIMISNNKVFFKSLFTKRMNILVLSIASIGMLAIKQLPIIRSSPVKVFVAYELIMYLLFAMTIIFLVSLLISKRIYEVLDPIIIIGVLSYEIYLIHGFTYFILYEISYIKITIFILLTFLCSYAFHYLYKSLCVRIVISRN